MLPPGTFAAGLVTAGRPSLSYICAAVFEAPESAEARQRAVDRLERLGFAVETTGRRILARNPAEHKWKRVCSRAQMFGDDPHFAVLVLVAGFYLNSGAGADANEPCWIECADPPPGAVAAASPDEIVRAIEGQCYGWVDITGATSLEITMMGMPWLDLDARNMNLAKSLGITRVPIVMHGITQGSAWAASGENPRGKMSMLEGGRFRDSDENPEGLG